MTKRTLNSKDLFIKGELATLWLSYQKKDFREVDIPWILATLCFRGALTEAKLLSKGASHSSQNDFFLLIASVRKGKYAEAKKLLTGLARRYRQLKTPSHGFFYFQALAFYAHFHGRYHLSLHFVERSREQALRLDEIYWKVLALDLLGHNLVQMGDIFQGIFYLEESKELANLIGNKSIVSATEISILSYQAQFSQAPLDDEKKIRRSLKKIKGIDNYSEGLLLLNLSHLQILTGQMADGLKTIEQARKVIFGYQLNRHMAMWHFEMAYAQYLNAQVDLSLHSLASAQELIDPKIDKKLMLKVLGLKCDILSIKGSPPVELKQQVMQLTRNVGDPRAFNKLARRGWRESQSTQDPLAPFFDDWKSSHWQQALQGLVSLGYWGLLREKVHARNENFIVSGLWKNGLLIVTPQAVHVCRSGMSEMLQNILREISRVPRLSKESLVKKIWGYEYDPARHDNLIYTQISRLRLLLGPLKNQLIGEAHSYRLFQKFQWLELSPLKPSQSEDKFQEPLPRIENFNIRQLQAVHMLKSQSFWQVRLYAEHFSVTPMTALRDLSELVERGLIRKVGRARATVYTL